MIGGGDVDGNWRDSINGRVIMMVVDGRGSTSGVLIMVGNGRVYISGVDERGMIGVGDGR